MDAATSPRQPSGAGADHLHRLMAAWQLLADLAFADLLLFVPRGERFAIVGQLRPYTARTLYPRDLVGDVVEPGWHPYVERAWREGRRVRAGDHVFIDAERVDVQAVPVRHRGERIAVLSVEAAELPDRPTGRLETAYLRAADALLQMVSEGSFPFDEGQELIASPRVGDGLVVLGASGRVQFASPNATSAFRRLGATTLLLGEPLPHPRIEGLLAEALAGPRAVESELEEAGAVVDLRIVPLLRGGRRTGSLLLCHEVSELRGRDRVISLREATIREVHHRVKNNLQTVASLLRLQARRLGDLPEAVAALEESVRRIGSIALVHETLSEELEGSVELAEVARRVVGMLEGSLGGDGVHIDIDAHEVRVDAAVATPLAVVLNELVQNAVEHGLRGGAGTVRVVLRRTGGGVRLEVCDLPDDETPPARATAAGEGLGLRLVRGLVVEELGGRFTLQVEPGGGSRASVSVPLR